MIKKQWSNRFGREVWGYACKIGGRRVRKFGFSTEAATKAALSKARIKAFEKKQGVAEPEEKPTVTLRSLVEKRKGQLQTTSRRRASARLLSRWLESLPAGLLVTDLATAHLQEWVDARSSEVRHETVFRELTDICAMLNGARDSFSVLETWTPPRRPRMKAPTRRRERVLTPDEAARILGELRRAQEDGESDARYRQRLDAADLLQIALLTAARRSEILSLGWTDVNFEWGTLRITGTKTERVRVVPMTPALVALLHRRKGEAGRAAQIFPARRASTDEIYRDACAPLGISYGRDAAGGWVLHDARHTAITAMLHAGNSLESVMAISGHSARVMAMRYAHSNEATRRAAVGALDQFAA